MNRAKKAKSLQMLRDFRIAGMCPGRLTRSINERTFHKNRHPQATYPTDGSREKEPVCRVL